MSAATRNVIGGCLCGAVREAAPRACYANLDKRPLGRHEISKNPSERDVGFGSPPDQRHRHPESPHLEVQLTKSGAERTLPLKRRRSPAPGSVQALEFE